MGRWIGGRWICVFVAPRFYPKTLVLKGFGAIWGKNLSAPNADPTTTDPTPHSRPSAYLSNNSVQRALPMCCAKGIFAKGILGCSAPGKWGRTQMGSEGFNRILTGLYFFKPVGVRLVPLKTHDFKGF